MLRDMFKKTYTRIDTRYTRPGSGADGKTGRGTGDSGGNVEKVQ